MINVKERILRVYEDFNEKEVPEVFRFSSGSELFDKAFAGLKKQKKVLFKPWPYVTDYSRPSTLMDGFESRMLKSKYEKYSDLYVYDPELNSEADDLVNDIYDKYETEIDGLQDLAVSEFPQFQLDVEDYVFLSNFSWVESEVEFYNSLVQNSNNHFRKKSNFHLLLESIIEHNLFLITFPDKVFYCSLY